IRQCNFYLFPSDADGVVEKPLLLSTYYLLSFHEAHFLNGKIRSQNISLSCKPWDRSHFGQKVPDERCLIKTMLTTLRPQHAPRRVLDRPQPWPIYGRPV
ncbi:hypothetical protein ALC56_14814, partial [Trachymyrmex septentrionalis]